MGIESRDSSGGTVKLCLAVVCDSTCSFDSSSLLTGNCSLITGSGATIRAAKIVKG